jgi:hypothetical protein
LNKKQQGRFVRNQAQGEQGMTDQEAVELSKVMTEPILPALKQHIAKSLLAYYKDKLQSRALPIVPAVRRMW